MIFMQLKPDLCPLFLSVLLQMIHFTGAGSIMRNNIIIIIIISSDFRNNTELANRISVNVFSSPVHILLSDV